MKRSEMLQIVALEFRKFDAAVTGEQRPASYYLADARELLSKIEQAGMMPPVVPSKAFKPADFKYGACCSMHCDCHECNPEFAMYKWEEE